ncbi:MAG: DUF3106 domain-containing protein [Lautropia sp.]|nr:DUF3106 domain-containing protein [Lautropia sp.]
MPSVSTASLALALTTALLFGTGTQTHARSATHSHALSAFRPASGVRLPAAVQTPANHLHPLTPAQLAAPVPDVPMPEHLPGDDSICLAAGDPFDLPIVSSLLAPGWNDLDEQTRQALAPFAPEWNSWPMAEKRPWLAFAERMRTLPEPQRQRARRRILEWANMSPEERRIARINHQQARKRPMPERMHEWEQYRALSWSERQALRHADTPPQPRNRQPLPPPPDNRADSPSASTQLRAIIHRFWHTGSQQGIATGLAPRGNGTDAAENPQVTPRQGVAPGSPDATPGAR